MTSIKYYPLFFVIMAIKNAATIDDYSVIAKSDKSEPKDRLHELSSCGVAKPKWNRKKKMVLHAIYKGGIWKSSFLSELIQWILDLYPELKFRAFDPDEINRSLLNFHPDHTSFIDVSKQRSMDDAFSALKDCDLVLVDGLGAKSKKTFCDWADEVNLWEIVDQLEVSITFLFMVSPGNVEVIEQAEKVMLRSGKNADYVIIKNCTLEGSFKLWEYSNAAALAKELNAAELSFQELIAPIAEYRAAKYAPLSVLVGDNNMELMDQQRCRNAAKALYGEFQRVRNFLLPKDIGKDVKIEAL